MECGGTTVLVVVWGWGRKDGRGLQYAEGDKFVGGGRRLSCPMLSRPEWTNRPEVHFDPLKQAVGSVGSDVVWRIRIPSASCAGMN